MSVFGWDNEKNQWLMEHRGVCFEQVVLLLEGQEVVDVLEHPNGKRHPGQKIAIAGIDNHVYLVPYVQTGDDIFLKTHVAERQENQHWDVFQGFGSSSRHCDPARDSLPNADLQHHA